MYTNWGIDPSLDYQHDESSVLASLSEGMAKAPVGDSRVPSTSPSLPMRRTTMPFLRSGLVWNCRRVTSVCCN